MYKRVDNESPDDDDYRRIAESMKNMDIINSIIDRDSFDYDYDVYFEKDNIFRTDSKHREAVFKEFMKLKPSVSKNNLFKEARGLSLEIDRQKNAKIIVEDIKEYKKKGASKVDLKNYDTKRTKKTGLGYVKGKVVYTNETTIKIKDIDIQRLRDLRGRFAKKR